MTTELAVDRWNASMQLTRAADYGIRVMIHLATVEYGERVSLADLVAATGTPDSFLTSRRGPSGGFEISEGGRHASMQDVIEAIDGRMCLNVCLSERRSCARKGWCPAHKVWVKAQAAMLEVLSTAMIADLAAGVGDQSPVGVDRTGAGSGGR
jgi:Rrf2 family protein